LQAKARRLTAPRPGDALGSQSEEVVMYIGLGTLIVIIILILLLT
jgi:hypothetical protein